MSETKPNLGHHAAEATDLQTLLADLPDEILEIKPDADAFVSQEDVEGTATAADYAKTNSFFSHSASPPEEVWEGFIQERTIGVLAADWGLGKTPVCQQLALCIVSQRPMLGRAAKRRPVVILDGESPYEDYQPSIVRIANALRLSPDDVRLVKPILRYGPPGDKDSERFREWIGNSSLMYAGLCMILRKAPNALIIIDPAYEILDYKENDAESVRDMYKNLRKILGEFPHAAFLLIVHLRKPEREQPRKKPKPEWRKDWYRLVNNRHAHFREVSGTHKICAHADVRIGMAPITSDLYKLVIAAIRRGKDGPAVFFEKSVNREGDYNGFVVINPPEEAQAKLSEEQMSKLGTLPFPFRFVDLADKPGGMPRKSLSRLLRAAQHAGLVHKDEGSVWRLDI